MIKEIKKASLSFLLVLLLTLVSCGEKVESNLGNTMSGDFFKIDYPVGFSTSKLESGGILKGKDFTINIDVEPFAAAREGDNKSIESKTDSIKSGLKEYDIKETAAGVIITGDTDKGKGIVLISPIDFYIVNVYTAPTPNSKSGFDLAYDIIKTFEITNPDYFLQKEIEKNNNLAVEDDNPTRESNSAESPENVSEVDDTEIENNEMVDSPKDEIFENEHLKFTIPKEWELTSDDSRITVLEPRIGSNLDVLSFSIQYVNLGDSISFDDFVSGIQSQTNGKKRTSQYGKTKYQVIQSSHNTYYEYHLITGVDSSNQIMISLITISNSIPEDAIRIIESIEIK